MLFEHIRMHIHSTTVDSASNEIVAAQDMAASQPGRDFAQLPNHKLIVRDRAHGSRRTLQRPWAADPYLDAIVTSVVLGPNSICQLIQRSDDLRAWYFSCTSASSSKGVTTCFRNLRAALHRYETLMTPISRYLWASPLCGQWFCEFRNSLTSPRAYLRLQPLNGWGLDACACGLQGVQ